MRLSLVVAGLVISALVIWTAYEGFSGQGVSGKKLLIRGGLALFLGVWVLVDFGVMTFGG